MFARLRLGTQLWVVVSLLVAAAAAGLTLYLTQVQTRALTAATEQRLAIKEDSLRVEAALLARNAALASASAALTLDFDFLQGVMAKTVAGDDTIEYGYIADAKDEIVVHSDVKQVGKTIPGAGSVPPDAKNGASVTLVHGDILEAVAPITVDSEVWGTVHYGVSYKPVLRDAERANKQLHDSQRRNFLFSLALALSLVVVCVCVSIFAASRLVRPLRTLESTIQRVLARNASLRVDPPRLRELAKLANGFNVLLERLDQRETQLRRQRFEADFAAWASERQLSDGERNTLHDDWDTYLRGATSERDPDRPKPRPRGSLRSRLMLLMFGLTLFSVLTIGSVLYLRLRMGLEQAMADMSQQIRVDLAEKGSAVTSNAALAMSQAASVREYLFMTQLVKSTMSADTDIVTGFIKDPKGRVLVHNDPQKTGQVAPDPEETKAMQSGRTESRLIESGAAPRLEITSPIQVEGSSWGTLSFDLSLDRQQKILADVRRSQADRIEEASKATAVGMGLFLLVAGLAAWLASRSVVGPLDRVTRDLDRICGGARTLRVEVYSCRELSTFSMSINELTAMTLDREKELEQRVRAKPATTHID